MKLTSLSAFALAAVIGVSPVMAAEAAPAAKAEASKAAKPAKVVKPVKVHVYQEFLEKVQSTRISLRRQIFSMYDSSDRVNSWVKS